MKASGWIGVLVVLVPWSPIAVAQVQPTTASVGQSLTLQQAEAIAVANQPQILASESRARAAQANIRQEQAGYLPAVGFNATGAKVADTGTATAAGNITTSSISDRFAFGSNLSQLVTDFGRTSALVKSARAAAQGRSDLTTLTRARIRLDVREAYFRVLGAEAVLRAAQTAQANRRLVVRQLTALAQSELRSTLDVHFATVLESEAELAVVQAQSTVAQQRIGLATAMGLPQPIQAALANVPVGSESLPASPDDLLQQAEAQRADLAAVKAQQQSAHDYAEAEKRLSYPTLNVLAAAGDIPYHDRTLHDNYAAAGFNLNIPVFNGGLFAALRTEAEQQANAQAHDVQQLQLEVGEQVRDAWYQADEARQSLDVTARLVAESREALRLAQDRYDAGLGSIVELNEAQLNETSAEISAADANYTYLTRRAELDFAAGLLN